MKRIFQSLFIIGLLTVSAYRLHQFIWNQYIPPQILNSQVEYIGNQLNIVTTMWFEEYVNDLSSGDAPYSYRIRKGELIECEILDEKSVLVNYRFHLASRNQEIRNNLGLYNTNKPYVFDGQIVLQWQKENGVWTIFNTMTPVQYQIQSDKFQEGIHRPQTDHYTSNGELMTYAISNQKVFVTYDGGNSYIEVKDIYEKICGTNNGLYQEYLSKNSYIVSPEFTAFVGHEDSATYLIYSLNQGKNWLTSYICDVDFKGIDYISKGNQTVFVTIAGDHLMGNDYYGTLISNNYKEWKFIHLDELISKNTTAVFWKNDDIGYYASSRILKMTSDQGNSWKEIVLESNQEIVEKIGYDPFDMIEEIYEKDGKIYIEVSQKYGDYTSDGQLIKALYQSTDGLNFKFVKEFLDNVHLAG